MAVTEKSPMKLLTFHEWDTLIDDFHLYGGPGAWFTAAFPVASLPDLALSSLLRKDFPLPLKLSILVFLDEFSVILFDNCSPETCDRFVDALRVIVQSPTDGSSGLKEQVMISSTSVLISVDSFSFHHVEAVVDLLLALVNRPNHGFDRHARAIACECLRQLERAFPGLLSDVPGHLWSLCQAERTHAVQSYLLLFTTVVYNVANQKLSVPLLTTSVPLVPFNAPNWMKNEIQGSGQGPGSGPGPNQKELRRALAFLLDSPYLFTSCAMMEFMSMVMPLALALELQTSMLRVQFFGMIYSFDPMFCHIVLLMHSHFPDAFDEKDKEIIRRLMILSKESQLSLIFRLLALHWLMALLNKPLFYEQDLGQRVLPGVFDPLALKALKLDLLVQCNAGSNGVNRIDNGKSSTKLLDDGLASVSDFKWLPPCSSETAVAFHILHKFLIGSYSHHDDDPSTTRSLMESVLFQNLQEMLVELTLKFENSVSVVVAFIQRLISCEKHKWIGEHLLQTLDGQLLPKLRTCKTLTSYFPLFHQIAENDTIPPHRLMELLIQFAGSLVEKPALEMGLKSWSQGTYILGICRILLINHKSSRLFLGLSRLLAFICLYFPDLEVRDHARIYLRMVVCVPGEKIRSILKKPTDGGSLSAHSSAFFSVQSPRYHHEPDKSKNLSSYIHLERLIPLLVKQSWSLSLPSLGFGTSGYSVKDSSDIQVNELIPDSHIRGFRIVPESHRIESGNRTLRVVDSKTASVLERLRSYFSMIPDFRHMPGIKIWIPCSLRFDADQYTSVWGDSSIPPAIFAAVLKYSSSAPYGSIPPSRIPFLMGESREIEKTLDREVCLDIVPIGAKCDEEEEEGFRASVAIELEPREPTPGLVEVSIEANAENGGIIQGKLRNVPVGIEDMFLKAIVPSDIPRETVSRYYSELFDALWEVCGAGSSSIGHEAFALKGGKGAAAISGSRSVKLLEANAERVVEATERYLAPFVVSVSGGQLANIVRDGGIIEDVVWKEEEDEEEEEEERSLGRGKHLCLTYEGYGGGGEEEEGEERESRERMGKVEVLIYMPPRFHLMFQMEVMKCSTLVHIRTDHWPSLAYVDDYLESLFLH